jgi:hypothetical protein
LFPKKYFKNRILMRHKNWAQLFARKRAKTMPNGRAQHKTKNRLKTIGY